MKFVEITGFSGELNIVNIDSIERIRIDNGSAVVCLKSGASFCTLQTPDQIVSLFKEAASCTAN